MEDVNTTAELPLVKAEPKQEKSPVLATEYGVQLRSLEEMYRFAVAVVKSGMAPKGFATPESVMIAMQAGAEIGLAPWTSLQSIAVINGRTTVWGDAALAVVKGHRDFLDIEETIEGEGDKMKASCRIKRQKQSDTLRTFSVEEAKKAGLWAKAGPWTQYPTRMLAMRARSFAMRDSFPDALKGISVREEVQDFREIKPATGRVVENTEVKLPE